VFPTIDRAHTRSFAALPATRALIGPVAVHHAGLTLRSRSPRDARDPRLL